MSANVEQVVAKTLIDFIDDHEEIGYDILSELNKFDQYISGRRQMSQFNHDSAENATITTQYLSESNIDRIFLEYANYSWTQCDQPIFTCKLCCTTIQGQEIPQFTNLDQFFGHLQKYHSKKIMDEQKEIFLDQQTEQLWVNELKRIQKFQYKHHSKEFLQEIDKILDTTSLDTNENSNLNSSDCHNNKRHIVLNETNISNDLDASISSNDTSSTLLSSSPSGHSKQTKKKKKRTSGQCDVCNRTFNDLYNLRIHKMIHTGEKPFQCEECGKRFRQYNKLKIHCITHTDKKPYVCDICDKGFRFRNYLSVHKRLHSGENPYKCKFCDEYFHSLHSRRLHTKLHHCDAKTFACPICGKILTAQCYLTAHIKRHTNQRDYKCDICSKCFFSQSQLKDHQLVHTNLKPYSCSVCNACFQRKSNYTQHLKIHTGEKTYIFHICQKTFAQNAGLYGHMKSHKKYL